MFHEDHCRKRRGRSEHPTMDSSVCYEIWRLDAREGRKEACQIKCTFAATSQVEAGPRHVVHVWHGPWFRLWMAEKGKNKAPFNNSFSLLSPRKLRWRQTGNDSFANRKKFAIQRCELFAVSFFFQRSVLSEILCPWKVKEELQKKITIISRMSWRRSSPVEKWRAWQNKRSETSSRGHFVTNKWDRARWPFLRREGPDKVSPIGNGWVG